MVSSFWPWKGDDKSPASFEKILSTLSAKISKTSSRLDALRQRSRRLKVLWTLYAGFAYLLYTIILTLLVGWRKWGPIDYSAVAGGPVIVYLVRLSLVTYYEYRTSSVQSQLSELQKQRDSTIEKLKVATKYNDTQDLLKKYGGTPAPKAKPATHSEHKNIQKQGGAPKDGRTTHVPPPTANIPGRNGPATFTKMPPHLAPRDRGPIDQQLVTASGATPPTQDPVTPQRVSEEFAPNAFPAAPQYSQVNERSRWYDRITDALLGEDETSPRARLALICDNCRLVNGQAPPGVRRLEDVGKWRCGGCGTMNSEESEVKRIVAGLRNQVSPKAGDAKKGEKDKLESIRGDMNRDDTSTSQDDGHESEITQYSSESSDAPQRIEASTAQALEPDNQKRRSTRSKKGAKKINYNGSA